MRKRRGQPVYHTFTKSYSNLKSLLNTKTAKEMANERHTYIVQFVEQFMKEWNVEI